MIKKLPEFKGYTIDKRLEQFRKVDREKQDVEFVDFNSEKGQELLGELDDES